MVVAATANRGIEQALSEVRRTGEGWTVRYIKTDGAAVCLSHAVSSKGPNNFFRFVKRSRFEISHTPHLRVSNLSICIHVNTVKTLRLDCSQAKEAADLSLSTPVTFDWRTVEDRRGWAVVSVVRVTSVTFWPGRHLP